MRIGRFSLIGVVFGVLSSQPALSAERYRLACSFLDVQSVDIVPRKRCTGGIGLEVDFIREVGSRFVPTKKIAAELGNIACIDRVRKTMFQEAHNLVSRVGESSEATRLVILQHKDRTEETAAIRIQRKTRRAFRLAGKIRNKYQATIEFGKQSQMVKQTGMLLMTGTCYFFRQD